ncbi:head-to-tail stopper [Gordonia phage Doggs]|nr:head-to-tail stopper [Gordonia phage Doggs]
MLGTETVGLDSETEFDADNNPIPGTGTPKPIDGCLVEPLQPLASGESVERDRSGTVSRVKVLMPITAGVSGDSRLVVRGDPYLVSGDPIPFVHDEDPELSGYEVIAVSAKG